MVKLNIITVVYNRVNTIEKTILSVLNQKYTNIDYCIIDGKSNDGTCEIIEKYIKHIKIYISEKDHGIYDAMNKGISMVNDKNSLILFLNSDDFLVDDNILFNLFQNYNNEDFIYGKVCYVNKNKKIIFGKQEKYETLHKGIIQHQATFCKKSVYDYLGNFNLKYKITSDYDFSIKVFKSNFKIFFFDHVVSVMTSGGVTTKYPLKMHSEKLNVIRSHYNIGFVMSYFFTCFLLDYIKSFILNFIFQFKNAFK